jgi:hypothetical protein
MQGLLQTLQRYAKFLAWTVDHQGRLMVWGQSLFCAPPRLAPWTKLFAGVHVQKMAAAQWLASLLRSRASPRGMSCTCATLTFLSGRTIDMSPHMLLPGLCREYREAFAAVRAAQRKPGGSAEVDGKERASGGIQSASADSDATPAAASAGTSTVTSNGKEVEGVGGREVSKDTLEEPRRLASAFASAFDAQHSRTFAWPRHPNWGGAG